MSFNRLNNRNAHLNRSRIALQRGLHVAHLLQRVAHITVGVGKGGRDADRLLVVHDRLGELALLLENRRQVGVGGGEFGHDVQGAQVETGGFVDLYCVIEGEACFTWPCSRLMFARLLRESA